tara:strand:- start:325 stop:1587 length:1263 start_codon:yes stop_codon:yes gene_type:complete
LYNTTKILNGTVELKGDKSLSHRLLMIASLIQANSSLKNISISRDVYATIECLRQCNIKIDYGNEITKIYKSNFIQPEVILNCENSGSTLRMLMGLLHGQGISAKFNGDASLQKRPMNRIMIPLKKMGATFEQSHEGFPISMHSLNNYSIKYDEKTKSAQVKTSLIFAGLGSSEISYISYNKATRDHTEKIMNSIGFDIAIKNKISVRKSNVKIGFNVRIPGDLSSAAFIIAAAILIPNSNVIIKNLLYNKTRMTFINILIKMGAKISIKNISNETCGMQSCDLYIKYSKLLKGVEVKDNDTIGMIDEIPILSIIGCFAKGVTHIQNIKELKVKESNRMHAIYHNLYNMGADISQDGDSIKITGHKKLYNTSINHFNDHRIAMSFEIMRLVIGESMSYEYSNIIDVSFPDFYRTIDELLS